MSKGPVIRDYDGAAGGWDALSASLPQMLSGGA